MWDDGEVITLDVPGTALATVWKEGFITHYRLIKPAVDGQTIADEAIAALRYFETLAPVGSVLENKIVSVIAKYKAAKEGRT
jgi:hypothetical protein